MPRPASRFVHEVRTLRYQGASAVAKATLQALAGYAAMSVPATQPAWRKLAALGEQLAAVRPTEPMARNLVRWFVCELKQRGHPTVSGKAWSQLVREVESEISYRVRGAEAAVVQVGVKLVRPGQVIFTHCHSSVAEGILTAAYGAGKRFTVYHTETRPLFQGHVTHQNLRQALVPTVMVADSAAAFLVSKHSGDDVQVDWVLLGADSLGRDGSSMNKIGSFGIALAAYDSKIPVYVAASLLKLDWFGESRLELRDGSELWPGAPKGTRLLNYAFDRVPARYIRGFITEVGIVRPAQVARQALRHCPWLNHRPR